MKSATIKELLDEGHQMLRSAGIENPRLAAELILQSILRLKKIDLFMKVGEPVAAEFVTRFRQMIDRKAKREPLQYILGETEWFGLRIKCDHTALIPRPETEIIVERALPYIRDISEPYVADIGTGTGCIAIAIAMARPDAKILAIDISQEALTLARENTLLNRFEDRIELVQSELFESLKTGQQFDLVISNPPYIRNSEFSTLMPEVREYEPSKSLVAGDDGLEVIRNLVKKAPSYLKPLGILAFEFGINHTEAVKRLALEASGYEILEIIVDYNGIDRGIVLRKE